jgi:hypothetical protein
MRVLTAFAILSTALHAGWLIYRPADAQEQKPLFCQVATAQLGRIESSAAAIETRVGALDRVIEGLAVDLGFVADGVERIGTLGHP